MVCGSKDIPKDREPEAPNKKQESEKEKEAREEAERETILIDWYVKTVNVGRQNWWSREQVGCDIHAYLQSKGSPWAGKVTGIILEGYEWDFSEVMQSREIV